ncbi:MAG: zinc-ribbon domain-containing protein [Dorea sp.]|nr:zinc-ribbon domain-containing protein [Dorea sp.]
MAYCVKCGEKVEDTAVICPVCGAMIPDTEAKDQSSGFDGYTYNTYHTYYDPQTRAGYFPENEVRNNKLMAVLCYLGILVFIPVFVGDRQSEYLKLHKNQGLVLFAVRVLLNAVERYRGWSAGIFGWFTGGLLDTAVDIVQFIMLILFIIGIVYACRGTKNELPVIGKVRIFK